MPQKLIGLMRGPAGVQIFSEDQFRGTLGAVSSADLQVPIDRLDGSGRKAPCPGGLARRAGGVRGLTDSDS
jgi:hypothetical protein